MNKENLNNILYFLNKCELKGNEAMTLAQLMVKIAEEIKSQNVTKKVAEKVVEKVAEKPIKPKK